jgi:hypothetical protein
MILNLLYLKQKQNRTDGKLARLEIPTKLAMKSAIFWNVMPCSLVKFTEVLEEHITCIFKVQE